MATTTKLNLATTTKLNLATTSPKPQLTDHNPQPTNPNP